MANSLSKSASTLLGKKGAKPAEAPVAEELPTVKVPETQAKAKGNRSTMFVNGIVSAPDAVKMNADDFGDRSKDLAFVCSLGDPSVSDATKINGKPVTLSRIIGYRFRALADMTVPDFGTTARFNGTRLNDAEVTDRFRDVKAGETFDLTRVETMALLSREEFGMCATGNPEAPVQLVVRFGKAGTEAPQTSAQLPDSQLNLMSGAAFKSIKELEIIDVLDYVPNKDGGTFASGTRTLKPEFEGTKFAPRALNVEQRMARRGKSGGVNADKRKNVNQAAAIQTLFARMNGGK